MKLAFALTSSPVGTLGQRPFQPFQPFRRAMNRWLSAFGFLLAVASAGTGAQAAALSAGEAKKVRAVVEAQLAAFEADDAQRAFSYAAPSIREMFGDADAFLSMVRSGYPVVYRHASVAFMVPELEGGEVTQAVRLVDAEGGAWLAVYRLQQQKDKSWRISGCQVVASEGREA
ncbi:hypothetical protein BH11PSE9_BH11PSE9_17660 [soil metagenome]